MDTSAAPLADTVLNWCWCFGVVGVAIDGEGSGLSRAGCGGVNASISAAKVASKPGIVLARFRQRPREPSCQLTSVQIPVVAQEDLVRAPGECGKASFDHDCVVNQGHLDRVLLCV